MSKEVLATFAMVGTATPPTFSSREHTPRAKPAGVKCNATILCKRKVEKINQLIYNSDSLPNCRIEYKEQKTEESFLEIPVTKIMRNKKSTSEIWARQSVSDQSNWDQLFESQTDLNLSLKTSKEETASTEDWTPIPSPSRSIRKIASEQNKPKITSKNDGKVLVVYLNKNGIIKYDYKDISMSMKELSNWLNEDPQLKEKLPISKSFSPRENSISSNNKFRERTIAEAVGFLDPLLQGIVFNLGFVGKQLCFKMTVSNIDKIVATTNHALSFEEEKA